MAMLCGCSRSKGSSARCGRRRRRQSPARVGPIASGVDKITIGAGNVEYSYAPARIRIKVGTTVTFTNVGDLPHDATAMKGNDWTSGALAKNESKTVTFTKPGVHYYICTPHPWMYGQVIVE